MYPSLFILRLIHSWVLKFLVCYAIFGLCFIKNSFWNFFLTLMKLLGILETNAFVV